MVQCSVVTHAHTYCSECVCVFVCRICCIVGWGVSLTMRLPTRSWKMQSPRERLWQRYGVCVAKNMLASSPKQSTIVLVAIPCYTVVWSPFHTILWSGPHSMLYLLYIYTPFPGWSTATNLQLQIWETFWDRQTRYVAVRAHEIYDCTWCWIWLNLFRTTSL